MIIGYHLTWLNRFKAGTDYYFHNLFRAILNQGEEHQFKLYMRCRNPWKSPKVQRSVAVLPGRLLNRLWEHLRILPMESLMGSMDIYHSPLLYMPYVKHAVRLATVHDIAFAKFGGLYEDDQQRENMASLNYLHELDRIIAVSSATKSDLIDHLGISSDKIRVIYEGVDSDWFYPPSTDEVIAFRKKRCLPKDFFLFVGTLEPRKNIPRLLNAFDAFCEKNSGSDCELLIAGGKGWLYEDIFQTHSSLKHKENVRFLGYVPREEMRLYYGSCTAFVFPSIYEGFGLPNLEAMACGAPVISSNAGAIPEVTGSAAILVNPNSCSELTTAMRKIYENPILRRKAGEKSITQASNFTWEKCAAETLQYYKEIV